MSDGFFRIQKSSCLLERTFGYEKTCRRPSVVFLFGIRSERDHSTAKENNPLDLSKKLSPQACLKGLLGMKKHSDVSRWFSFSGFGAKGIMK